MSSGEKPMTPAFSVIVCAYTEKRWDDLVANIRALQEQSHPPHQVIVVIDHNPALFQRAKREIAGVLVAENTRRPGLSGARNSGLPLADGDVVAFIDEDAIPGPRWLELLASHYRDEHVVGVGGAIHPLWAAGRPAWFPGEFDWVVGCTYAGMPTSAQPVRNLIGCNMSFRRWVFSRVGGFTEGIGRIGTRPVGCEETELCIRLRQYQADALLIYDPEAYVEHRVPPARAKLRYFLDRCYSEGLSKAAIVSLIGQSDGLSSERQYTLQTLPRGLLRGLLDTLKLDFAGMLRAGAIVLGLSTTGVGYLLGRLARKRTLMRPQSSSFPV